jgi:hypothetical protein
MVVWLKGLVGYQCWDGVSGSVTIETIELPCGAKKENRRCFPGGFYTGMIVSGVRLSAISDIAHSFCRWVGRRCYTQNGSQ